MKYSSYFFKKNKKKAQALEFLNNLDRNVYKKIIQEMKLLEEYGIDTNHVSIKKFQNDIWKIRVKNPSNNIRLFFYIIKSNIYYLYAFNKNTQKTPEGKKITINNLKIDLINSLKKNNYQEFLQKIYW